MNCELPGYNNVFTFWVERLEADSELTFYRIRKRKNFKANYERKNKTENWEKHRIPWRDGARIWAQHIKLLLPSVYCYTRDVTYRKLTGTPGIVHVVYSRPNRALLCDSPPPFSAGKTDSAATSSDPIIRVSTKDRFNLIFNKLTQ